MSKETTEREKKNELLRDLMVKKCYLNGKMGMAKDDGKKSDGGE